MVEYGAGYAARGRWGRVGNRYMQIFLWYGEHATEGLRRSLVMQYHSSRRCMVDVEVN